MGVELNQRLFSAADSLRSKMDASEYKNYLLGLIFYKYLSDKLLQKVVELGAESLEEYDTVEKQTEYYIKQLEDEAIKQDVIDALLDTLRYAIEPDYLFNVLAEKAHKNTFQLNDLKKGFLKFRLILSSLKVYLMMLIWNQTNLA
jgi:type I restriction enzyme M protein